MYTLDDFKRLGLYDEKPPEEEHEFTEDGKILNNLPSKISHLLNNPGGSSHGGDRSKQDFSVIRMMVEKGYDIDNVRATFLASARGRDIVARKNGHHSDYLDRTIRKVLGQVNNSKLKIDFKTSESNPGETGLIISMAHEVETEKVNWLWPGYIPAGRLTLVAGDPGMGKSTIVGDVISRLSKGRLMPSGVRGVTGGTLIASAEDSPEDTIVPRLIASEANLSKVGIIREVRNENEVSENESRYLTFPRDLELLRATLTNRGFRLLIIDPLNAFVERGIDTYKDQDIRGILHPLQKIAQDTGTAILIVAHLNKKEDANTLYRIGGSIGFIGACRSVLAVTRDDEQRILFSLKNNLVKRPPALSYEIKEVRKTQKPNNTWKGEEIITSSAIRWLGEVDFDPFSKKKDNNPGAQQEEEARIFLRSILAQGMVQVDQVYEQGKQVGITRSLINKVRASTGVTSRRQNGDWFWQISQDNE